MCFISMRNRSQGEKAESKDASHPTAHCAEETMVRMFEISEGWRWGFCIQRWEAFIWDGRSTLLDYAKAGLRCYGRLRQMRMHIQSKAYTVLYDHRSTQKSHASLIGGRG